MGFSAVKASTATAAPSARGARRRVRVAPVTRGVSPNAITTSSEPASRASRAARTAWAVPRRSTCGWTEAPGAARAISAATASCPGSTTTAMRVAPASRAAARTWPSMVRPATACSTLGRSDRIRVPLPAASTMAVRLRPPVRAGSVEWGVCAVIVAPPLSGRGPARVLSGCATAWLVG